MIHLIVEALFCAILILALGVGARELILKGHRIWSILMGDPDNGR